MSGDTPQIEPREIMESLLFYNHKTMNDLFLPENYQIPSGANYMKLQDGENTFRVLSSAVVGFEYWNTSGKPVRMKVLTSPLPSDIRINDRGERESIKTFWAFVVWNYDAKQIQVLEITQKTIMQGIKTLVDNKKWGHPRGYDITVTRTGSGFDTEYTVMPSPAEPVSPEIVEAYKARPVNLEALFTSEDPFNTELTSAGTKIPDFSEVDDIESSMDDVPPDWRI